MSNRHTLSPWEQIPLTEDELKRKLTENCDFYYDFSAITKRWTVHGGLVTSLGCCGSRVTSCGVANTAAVVSRCNSLQAAKIGQVYNEWLKY